MRAQPGFKLTRQATLALLISAAFSAAAEGAPAGRVDFAIGGVSVTGADGRQRPLAKGATLESGDMVSTAADGRAHLRFADGGYTSLQPETQFRIDEYRFDGTADGQEKGFFSLLKGGLRTITGAIGRTNKSTYQVRTSTATIGVRGTEYLAKVTNSLELSVGGGTAEVRTQESPPRTFLVPEGSTISLAAPGAAPIFTQPPILPPKPADVPAKQGSQPTTPPGQTDTQQAGAPTAPPPQPAFIVGDRTNSSGAAAIVPTGVVVGLFSALRPGPGYALAFSIGGEGGSCQIGCASNGSSVSCGKPVVTLTPAGGFSWTQSPNLDGDFISGGPVTIEPNTPSTIKFSGGSVGGVLGWGVFFDGTLSPTSAVATTSPGLGANEGAHAILFLPTPNMPTTGTATYTMIPGGFTTPTFDNNLGGGGLSPGGTVTSARMTVNFGAVSNQITGNASFSFPGSNAYGLSLNADINGAGFIGSGNFSRTSGTATACAASCSANVLGGFAGMANPAPPFAGYVYKVFGPGFNVNGAIASQRQGGQ